MTGDRRYDEGRLGALLRMLTPAPTGWVQAAQQLPASRRSLDDIVARAEADLAFRTALVADLEAALTQEGYEPDLRLVAELHATTGGDLEKRNDALERKLDDAAAVPILIADTGADAASLAELAADRGEGAYRADAAVAAVLAAAGARAASHLVRVNLGVREGDARLARARRSADAAADAAARALDAAG